MNLFHSYNLTNVSITEECSILFSPGEDKCEITNCRTTLEGWLWGPLSPSVQGHQCTMPVDRDRFIEARQDHYSY